MTIYRDERGRFIPRPPMDCPGCGLWWAHHSITPGTDRHCKRCGANWTDKAVSPGRLAAARAAREAEFDALYTEIGYFVDTPEKAEAEAKLWDRYGEPEIAARLRAGAPARAETPATDPWDDLREVEAHRNGLAFVLLMVITGAIVITALVLFQ